MTDSESIHSLPYTLMMDLSISLTDCFPWPEKSQILVFLIGRSYCAAFPGFCGKQASEIKAKPGTIWSMMSSTDSGFKMSIELNNKAVGSECFQNIQNQDLSRANLINVHANVCLCKQENSEYSSKHQLCLLFNLSIQLKKLFALC